MPALDTSVTASVRPAALSTVLRQLAVPALLWGVVLLGRGVCLLAQRVPPLVALVRAVYRWMAAREGHLSVRSPPYGLEAHRTRTSPSSRRGG